MDKHRLTGRLALREDGGDGALHDFKGVVRGDGRDERARVREIHVHRAGLLGRDRGLGALPTRGDFHTRNHQKTTRLLEERTVFGERFETNFAGSSGGRALLNPIGAEARDVVIQDGAAAPLLEFADDDGRRLERKPTLALGHDVVVGHREEVIAGALVAVGDHLGIIVAITPQ